jgi:arylsulfatase A-like enzyme
VVLSDHGESFGERGQIDHGGMSVSQEQVRVPFIIKLPRSNRHQVVNEPVSGTDLLPTVMDVLDFEIPNGLDGRSLFGEETGEPRTIFTESFPGGRAFKINPARFKRIQRAAISGSLKLVTASDGKREFYDLAADPAEARNIFRTEHARTKPLENALQVWMKVDRRRVQKELQGMGDTIERLKSLGYVQ